MWVGNIVDLFNQGSDFFRNHLPLDHWPYLTHTALAAAAIGLIMSLWGARLLRLVYVACFMVAGAAVGVELARISQLDLLIGLVLGAGFAGFLGYLLYRCWVGLTAGAVAMLLVMMISGPRILSAELQAFEDDRLGVSTDEYVLAGPTVDQSSGFDSLGQYLSEVKVYFWQTRRFLAIRMLVMLGIAGFLGLMVGMALPRFTTIVGTSLIGVLGLAVSAGLLVSMHLPGLWTFVETQAYWFMGGVLLYLIAALFYQVHNSRIKKVVAAKTA
ncbi:MAG: hypothetical protein ACYTBZ_06775 [Planctomycetota bacterium]|jgi:hypothetical protein